MKQPKSKILDYIVRRRPFFWLAVLWYWLTHNRDCLFSQGIHYIDGTTGAGKTLLMNIMQRHLTLPNKGFMYSNKKQFFNERIVNFSTDDIWNNGEQQYRLIWKREDFQLCQGIIFDEINERFNRRQNNQRDYNDVFIPLIGSIAKHRHQHIPRVYMLGQDLELQDTQISKIAYFKHSVKSRKTWWYYYWKNELQLVYAPKKLKVIHYVQDKTKEKWIRIGKSIIKVKPIHLETYNTFGFEKDFENLPFFTGQKISATTEQK